MPAPPPLARGDVVLAAFPFADLSATKRRPAVIVGLHPSLPEFTLAFVTSRQTAPASPQEVPLPPGHPEFPRTGLSVASTLRAGKLVTLAASLLTRRLGRLGPLLLADLDRALIHALGVDPRPLEAAGRARERARLAAVHDSGGPAALLADLGLAPTAE
jgi:mRNA interferase MazF